MTNLVAGPYLFVDKFDSRIQKTICVLENPWKLSIRDYNEGRQIKEEIKLVPDFETAIVRLQSSRILYETEGLIDKGIANATKGEAPKVQSQPAMT